MGKKKRTAAVLLILVLGLYCLAACGKESKSSDYIGNWKLAGGTVNGISLTAEQLTMTLGAISLDITEEGKIGKKEGIGLDEKGKWSQTESGIIVSDVDGTNPVVFHFSEGALTGTVKGVEITLKK